MTSFREELALALRGHATPLVWISLTVILGLSGPLGTVEDCALTHRMLFWSTSVGALILLNAVFRAFVHGVLGWRHIQRDIPLIALGVAAMSFLPFRAVAQGQIVVSHPILTSTASETLVFLFLTALGIGCYTYLAHVEPAGAVVPATPGSVIDGEVRPPEPELPPLVQRLDPAIRGTLVSITGRDHYVDVRTVAGQGSLLMRFSDAIREAAPQDGAQVHRSHWVAWDAVSGVERDAGRLYLRLGEARVPVSRANRVLLAKRGML